jgi:hypothetical protein
MSIGHKSSGTQVFRMMLYRRALHPELFDLQGRFTRRLSDYEIENWVTPYGHIVRFQNGGSCLTEAVIQKADHLPELGLVHALPCLGEKEFELEPEGNMGYVTTVQTEVLTDNLYMATLREMRDFASEASALCYEWVDDEGVTCLSLLDTQTYKREYHVQSYHMLGSAGVVLRTQSIFEVL